MRSWDMNDIGFSTQPKLALLCWNGAHWKTVNRSTRPPYRLFNLIFFFCGHNFFRCCCSTIKMIVIVGCLSLWARFSSSFSFCAHVASHCPIFYFYWIYFEIMSSGGWWPPKSIGRSGKKQPVCLWTNQQTCTRIARALNRSICTSFY